jgi:hypothetical protein
MLTDKRRENGDTASNDEVLPLSAGLPVMPVDPNTKAYVVYGNEAGPIVRLGSSPSYLGFMVWQDKMQLQEADFLRPNVELIICLARDKPLLHQIDLTLLSRRLHAIKDRAQSTASALVIGGHFEHIRDLSDLIPCGIQTIVLLGCYTRLIGAFLARKHSAIVLSFEGLLEDKFPAEVICRLLKESCFHTVFGSPPPVGLGCTINTGTEPNFIDIDYAIAQGYYKGYAFQAVCHYPYQTSLEVRRHAFRAAREAEAETTDNQRAHAKRAHSPEGTTIAAMHCSRLRPRKLLVSSCSGAHMSVIAPQQSSGDGLQSSGDALQASGNGVRSLPSLDFVPIAPQASS